MTVFIATMGNGLARAEQRPDGSWIVEQSLQEQYIHCLANDPAERSLLYAGVQDQGIWRSNDAGCTWQPA